MSRTTAFAATPIDNPPWWRLPIVWMVIAGPAAVVVAGFATLAIAIRNPDPVYTPVKAQTAAEQPAMQARNHAATPQR
jgi:uncharacterized protein